MFWADKLLENVIGAQVINDSFTPSGSVHMGSLKGPVIHDVLYKILKEKEIEVDFKYGFDDMDVIDGLPDDLKESHQKYMGVPLFKVPAPDGEGSFADYFIGRMKKLLKDLDINPNFYRTSEIYSSGSFDDALKIILDDVQKVRDVYAKIYKKEIAKDWYPVQVVCTNCRKLGTTKVIGWDGREVEFECMDHLVTWAKGCGTKGKISPFGGNGKMVWKVEWAAKWWKFGVTIEGAGKDHASAGGSYDVAMEIVRDVFDGKQPLKLAYEFFLSGGKKMSSSKGLGLSGENLIEVAGSQRTRFLMIKTSPNVAVEFTPKETDAIPTLFDAYQSFAFSDEDDQKRAFQHSQVEKKETIPEVRFATIAQWVQMPGSEGEIEKSKAEDWTSYAKIWVEKYAPDKDRFEVQERIPEIAKSISFDQKEYLKRVADNLKDLSVEDLQAKIYDLAKENNLKPQDAFAAIYLSLIGKNHGPKAAALIGSLDRDFVKKRFNEVSLL